MASDSIKTFDRRTRENRMSENMKRDGEMKERWRDEGEMER